MNRKQVKVFTLSQYEEISSILLTEINQKTKVYILYELANINSIWA